MKNLVITGFMGTGKSTVGSIVAKSLSLGFVDTDLLAEEIAGMSIHEMFTMFGETFFRRVEKEAIRRASNLTGCVIATGGGALIDEENYRLLASTGIIVCLTASPQTILNNLKESKQRRPLIEGRESVGYIDKLMKERERYYKKADYFISIEGRDPCQVASLVIECYNNAGSR